MFRQWDFPEINSDLLRPNIFRERDNAVLSKFGKTVRIERVFKLSGYTPSKPRGSNFLCRNMLHIYAQIRECKYLRTVVLVWHWILDLLLIRRTKLFEYLHQTFNSHALWYLEPTRPENIKT